MEIQIEMDKVPFENVTENFNAIVNTAFRLYANDVVKNAKLWIAPDKSGLHNRTGRLRDSIRMIRYVQYSPNSGAAAYIVAGNTRTPYSSIHEYGGTIRPTKGKYLTFSINGQWVKVRQVTIPARPYLRPSEAEMRPQFDSYLQNALDRIVKKG